MKKIINLLFSLILMVIMAVIFATMLGVSPLITIGALLVLGSIPSPKGVLMVTFVDLVWADGTVNMGGLKVIGYYAPVSDILNFPELPTNPLTAADEVTLESVTGFTFITGKNFLKLYSTEETASVTSEPQGEVDGQSFVHKGKMFFPGSKVEAMAFMKAVNNGNMVFVFEEASGDARRVIGSVAFPAKCKPSHTTGEKTADRKGMTLEIQSYGITPVPFYTGAISLTPAV